MNTILLKNGFGYKVFWDQNNDILFTAHENGCVPEHWSPCVCINGLICGSVNNKYTIHHHFDDDEEINWNLPVELKLLNASNRDEISFEEVVNFTMSHSSISLLNELRHGHSKLKELK